MTGYYSLHQDISYIRYLAARRSSTNPEIPRAEGGDGPDLAEFFTGRDADRTNVVKALTQDERRLPVVKRRAMAGVSE